MNTYQSIWCLHGNLQGPDVWEQFQESLLWPMTPVDLFEDGVPSMALWVEQFCAKVSEYSGGHKHFLVGYSLGGRLAMQVLARAPELWDAAVIVSADPGCYAAEEKQKQLRFDREWGARFATGDWETVVSDWNSLDVFCGIPNPMPPKEDQVDRQQAGLVFDRFSKGRQPDLTPALAALTTPPVLYVSGGLDTKYVRIGQQLEESCRVVSHSTIPDAGHRVPWEKPEAWCEAINAFFDFHRK